MFSVDLVNGPRPGQETQALAPLSLGARRDMLIIRGANTAGIDMKAMKHFRNVCVGACLMAGSVYYGGVPGFVLGALGIALIIHSSNAPKSE